MKQQRVVMFPYKMESQSGKNLAQAIGVRRVYHDGKYQPRNNDVIINWGNSKTGTWWQAFERSGAKILNHPKAVYNASNKLTAFESLKAADIMIPDFTTSRDEATGWVNEGSTICVREKLQGHSAMGLSIVTELNDGDNLLHAPLYTKYVKKVKEYRVHVFLEKVIDVAQKKLRNGLADDLVDYRVRNHKGGWVYARDDIEIPEIIKDQAILAVRALGLSFGAVDIGWNDHYQAPTVYEVNSAPGLAGTTLYRYAAVIDQLFDSCKLNLTEPENTFDDALDFDVSEFTPDKVEARAAKTKKVPAGIGDIWQTLASTPATST